MRNELHIEYPFEKRRDVDMHIISADDEYALATSHFVLQTDHSAKVLRIYHFIQSAEMYKIALILLTGSIWMTAYGKLV